METYKSKSKRLKRKLSWTWLVYFLVGLLPWWCVVYITHAEDNPPNIDIEITECAQSEVIDSPVFLRVVVTSTYELKSVVATFTGTEIETKTLELTFYYPEGYNKTAWGAYVRLPNWSSGLKSVHVVATDIFSTQANAYTSVAFNPGPQVSTTAPDTNTVIRTDTTITAECLECNELVIKIYKSTDHYWPEETSTGEHSVSVVLHAADYNGYTPQLCIMGVYADGKRAITRRDYYVETSELLQPFSGELPPLTPSQGWVAKNAVTADYPLLQIFIKPPDEDWTQVTAFSTASFIIDTEQADPSGHVQADSTYPIPPNGECMFVHGTNRYLTGLSFEPKLICSSLGSAFYADGWFVKIGEVYFSVQTEEPTPPVPEPPVPEPPAPKAASGGGGGGCFISSLTGG